MTTEHPVLPHMASPSQADLEPSAYPSPAQPAERIHIEGFIREGQTFPQDEHRDVLVTVIRGGASLNGYYYNEAVLQRLAALLDNAHAYVDHARSDGESVARSVRDIAGFYRAPHYVPPTAGEPGRVDATLHILESADWLWRLIREACALGQPGLIGLSIDIYGSWQLRESQDGARPLREVVSISALNSCDIVTRPSAGGSIRRLLHDYCPSHEAIPQRGHHMSDTAPQSTPQLLHRPAPPKASLSCPAPSASRSRPPALLPRWTPCCKSYVLSVPASPWSDACRRCTCPKLSSSTFAAATRDASSRSPN